jgi:hypothetical protein
MAVLDDAKKNILSRLKELESSRQEYDELRKAADDLGLEYEPNGRSAREPNGRSARTASPAPQAARSKRAQGKRGARKIAPAGQRRQQMLDAITAKPGVTVAEVAKEIGLPDASSLYRFQRQLLEEKAIRKEGSAMYLRAEG